MHSYATELVAASAWADFFTGMIDELRIWNHPLDSTAIARNLLNTLGSQYYTSSDSGLIAYYRMDLLENLGINSDGADDLRDLSINANHLDTEGNPTIEPSGAFLITGIKDRITEIPNGYTLNQNYLNPFNPSTTIKFVLPEVSKVVIDIFNSLGQQVDTIVENDFSAGFHSLQYDAGQLPGGVYFYRIKAGAFQQTRKMLLLR